MRLCHASHTLSADQGRSFSWLRALVSCFHWLDLHLPSSEKEPHLWIQIILFMGIWLIFFLSQLAEVCCHSFPEPARSQGVREAVCPCCTQTGSARSHLASATHLFSWDPETSVVHAVSSTPQSSGLEEMGSVPSIALGLTHPGCSWVTRWHCVLWFGKN